MWSPFNLDTYCHVGPMAKTVSDALLMQNVASGPHSDDAVTIRPKYVLPEQFESIAGLKKALSIDFGEEWSVDDEIRANTLVVADALRSAGL
ncbi:amidase family protein [Pseudomonas sp. RIT-PI-q]|uniref:amidase family protein n=1 Tax=Pseudomonas sp. RIT-PI-q TaxID=1690247 RepID=UPI00191C0D0D|nr:amidase family protein [Pseudomonas sp. RIT-PI-q]